MADVIEPFLNGINPTAAGTFYSDPLATEDRRDFAVYLEMPTTGGGGGDTLAIVIEESFDQSFTNAYRTRVIDLTNPSTAAVTQAFTTVAGGTTLPASTSTATNLRQKYVLRDTNYNSYLRVRYTITGTATSFTNVFCYLASNRKV